MVVVVVVVAVLLHFPKQLSMCALDEFSTENDIVGVAAIDSLWFIDIMRAFMLHVLHYIVYLTIYFQLMAVATDTATASAAAAETIQHAVPVNRFSAEYTHYTSTMYRKLDGIVPRY